MSTRPSRQPRYIAHSIDLFQGGMDSDASPYMVAPGVAILGENIEFYRDNTLRARRGHDSLLAVPKTGASLTHRLQGEVKTISRNGTNLQATTTTTTVLGQVPNEPHVFLRALNSIVIVQPSGIRLLDGDGVHTAAPPTPLPLTGVVESGGTLKEGKYTYVYSYLLRGGEEGVPSEELVLSVNAIDSKITLTFPDAPNHPKLFRKRLYRRDPDGGIPLLIADLAPSDTTFIDTGAAASAMTPIQGIRSMPGGNLALLHNRRLLVVAGDTLHYSYPGSIGHSNVFWSEKLNLPTGEPVRAICPVGQGVVFFGLETALFMNGVPAEGGSFAPLAVPDGCVGQRAWTQAEDGTLLYVGKSGVFAMQGVQAARISDPVNNYFRELSVAELAQTTVVYDQQERRLLVGLPGRILAYHFQTRAWTVWTLPGTELDWFEGRIHTYKDGAIGILGEAANDDGLPIQGKFVSGVSGLDDPVVHKLYRRVGLQVSASPQDTVDLHVRSLATPAQFEGLPEREITGATWGVSIWGEAQWNGNHDTVQSVSLPDSMQGRYFQFTITFETYDAGRFTLMGPVVVEYRPTYRYGRNP